MALELTVNEELEAYISETFSMGGVIRGNPMEVYKDPSLLIIQPSADGNSGLQGINSGIQSSKFDPGSSQKFQRPVGSFNDLVPGTWYYAEVQRGITDESRFLAVLEGKGMDSKRYMNWITNDREYAGNHSEIFDPNVNRVKLGLFGGVEYDNVSTPKPKDVH